MRNLKIILSVLFVLIVSFFVVRGCVHKKIVSREEEIRESIPSKKVFRKRVGEPVGATRRVARTSEGPRMAIILDDWGNNFSLTTMAIDIQRPVTLSILPHLAQSGKIAEEAFNNNLGVMLHMPMEPKNKTKGLEPHTIMTVTPDRDIVSFLDSALESVPHAEGVNNHMGSAATSDLRVMRTVLKHLVSKGLFFIDSDTISTTVASLVAKEVGIPFAKREVFIDNDSNPESIRRYLRRAKTIALKQGRVVVIGHDKKATLLVIKQMVPEIEQAGIRFVLAKDLVE